MSEPIRHSDSERSRRKALHFAKNLRDELEHMKIEHGRQGVRLAYMLDRIYKLTNRLEARCHE